MLITVKAFKGYSIQNASGETIGKVREFYFDDHYWTVRYLVASTGTWLPGRQVLLSPYALVGLDPDGKNVVSSLTKQQIEDSPSLDSDKPVSRQFEDSYYGYYGWPTYWGGPYNWGYSPQIERNRDKWGQFARAEKTWDRHLRSTHEVTGYHIVAADGEIGHVEDFVIDDENWEVRYLIVNTSNWWMGKKVLVSPQWIEKVIWSERRVVVDLDRETIRQSPEFTAIEMLTRDYEAGLYGHYNRNGYWVDEVVAV